jgi:DNA-damage-inducible protein J
MAQSTFSIRMDEDIKKQFDVFCASVGMNATTAFNMFARAVLRERRIPFEVTDTVDPFYSSANMASLLTSMKQLEEGKVVIKTLDELERTANEPTDPS